MRGTRVLAALPVLTASGCGLWPSTGPVRADPEIDAGYDASAPDELNAGC